MHCLLLLHTESMPRQPGTLAKGVWYSASNPQQPSNTSWNCTGGLGFLGGLPREVFLLVQWSITTAVRGVLGTGIIARMGAPN